ncbi:MAG: hypothetical protein KDD38_08675, partial [Bdellovibrionales bacterium]|nr:hypothetical protein [Bdellovibrionales bacterium]
MRSRLALVLVSLTIGFSASAEKLDVHTHDMVIQKLELVLSGLSGQKSEGNVLNRLADLYADRARLISIEEIEKNCHKCVEAKTNREKAISYYQRAFSKVSKAEQPRVLLQIA